MQFDQHLAGIPHHVVVPLAGQLGHLGGKHRHRLAHGNFLPWIEAEFSMADRTALRFMQAAEAFAGKSATVADLPATVLYALASPSTPEPIREEFMREAEAAGGAISPVDSA
ncbi:DUF3102 domain-containing protein [Methylobacterium sp. E-065]|uniref:DUF3102 domain-containing protein n=1 Tax=Methylobacterium sp. E-065 TaxID=2836583 RepID=UPI001FBBADF7|nr:DUF3102 domain-containing protein [Methylobacterium sp. E-065]MCJ2016944.1 DUF3102 domain-containing protein [Methylobacterium sp. E-065]